MAIKSTKVVQETETIDFPKLMIHKPSNMVVLFSRKSMGMVVNAGNTEGSWGVGVYADDFIMGSFSDYHGSVVLSNNKE